MIKSVAQNALRQKNRELLGIMERSDIFARHLQAERNSIIQPTYEEAKGSTTTRKALPHREAASYCASAENIADASLREDVEMEDVNV